MTDRSVFRRGSHAGIGVTSIFVVLLTVCLTAMAVLSLVSAKSGITPYARHAAAREEWYAAEAALVEQIADAHEAFLRGELETDGEGRCTLSYDMGDGTCLEAVVRFTAEGGYELISQRRVSAPALITLEGF